jgi:hypothetical protein
VTGSLHAGAEPYVANKGLTPTQLANNTAANQAKSQQSQTTHQAWYHYFIW